MMAYMALAILLSIAVGSVAGWKITGILFVQKVFTLKNAKELLLMSRPEEWNELRLQHPEWKPDIRSMDLSGKNLAGVDFREALLDEANLTNAILDNALLTKASLRNANLDGASLRGADFREADLENAKIKRDEPTRNSREHHDLQKFFENPELIDELSAREFEELVALMFNNLGYKATLTPPTRDGGYDLNITRKDELGEINIIAEVKKYSIENKIGLATVRGLLGVVINSNAHKGILVTSSYVSQEANRLAENHPQIEIINRDSLIELLKEAAKNQAIKDASR